MAFSMSNVVVKKRNVELNTRNLFSYINNNPILTENVKEALSIYLKYRLKHYGVMGLQKDGFKRLVDDLLEKCCYKSIGDISGKDIYLNERNIIYQIKRSMELNAIKTIYCKEQTIYERVTQDVYIKPRNAKTYVDIDAVKEYFKEFDLI